MLQNEVMYVKILANEAVLETSFYLYYNVDYDLP